MQECTLCLAEILDNEEFTTLRKAEVIDSDDIVHTACAKEFAQDLIELEQLFKNKSDI
jgi:hypothetical protein